MVRAFIVAGMSVSVGSAAKAQLAPGELSEPGFLGPGTARFLEERVPRVGPEHEKTPLVLQTPIGTVYGFWRNGDPFLVVTSGKMDFGAAIALPSDKLVLNGLVWIYSRKDVTLAPNDFPEPVRAQLLKFWPSGQIKLLPKGFLLRAEPAGEVLDDLRSFLSIDRVDGTTVLAIAKNSMRNSTSLMLFGTVRQPFGMDMTLTNPEIGYTKKEGKPRPTVSLASDVSIYGHAYEFKAEGSDPKKPDIFLLKTPKLNPQDLVNIERAMSKPLFGLAAGADPGWRFDLVPTFSLHPPKEASPNFPPEDQAKVVVYAAMPGADRPDWGVKGPGIKVRGNLQLDLQPVDQDIAAVEVVMDKSSLNMTFGVTSFSVPGSSLGYGAATATVSASAAKTAMTISAAVNNPCFKQQASFTVDRTGIPKPDITVNQALSQADPTAFANRYFSCVRAGADIPKFVLAAGGEVLGFAADQMVAAAAPIFGAEVVATAAKVIGYPVALVGAGLGKVLDKSGLADLGVKLYGVSEVGSLVKGAGGTIEDVMNWALARGHGAAVAGYALRGAGFAKEQVLAVGGKIFPADQVGKVAYGVGYTAEQFMGWAKGSGNNLDAVGKLFKDSGFDGNQVLDAAAKLYPKEVPAFAKSAGYTVEQVMRWPSLNRQGAQAVGQFLGTTVFSANELLNAGTKVFSSAQVATLGKGAGLAAKDIYKWSYDSQMALLGRRPAGFSAATLEWTGRYMQGAKDAARIVSFGFDKDNVLNAGKEVYSLSWSGVAQLGGAAGYGANALADYFKVQGVDKKEIATILRAGGYAKNEVTGAVMTVYKVGVDEAESLFNGVAEGAGKACKAVLGWTGAC
jgi:hypothetical protein